MQNLRERDSSEKPTARHERGFVADSPTRRARPKENLFKKSASSVACATHRATHIYMLSLHYFVRHILFIYHIRDFRHIGGLFGRVTVLFSVVYWLVRVMVSFAGYLRLKAADAAFLFGSALSFV
ncbi:hypothetical protein CMT92_05855 [Elizabethkingia anophelis]|nr:hypothetical protein [Elizabethkingia anophelis]